MPKLINNQSRPFRYKAHRKIFIIAAEGRRTEPQYFNRFNSSKSVIHIECLKSGTDSAPRDVLKRMRTRIKEKGLNDGDEAWLVVDRDHWDEAQLKELLAWSRARDNYGFALSNPNFEYWLLLHFEEGDDVPNAAVCASRLKRHLPGYDKSIVSDRLMPGVGAAVDRARRKDTPPCADWPRATGTTVYKLVEKLL